MELHNFRLDETWNICFNSIIIDKKMWTKWGGCSKVNYSVAEFFAYRSNLQSVFQLHHYFSSNIFYTND